MAEKKHIIWDLGNTLLAANTWCFAQHVGLTDFMLYPLLEWKNPKKIHEIAFNVLEDNTYKHPGYPHATASGIPLPALILHWLTGTITEHELHNCIAHSSNQWQAEGLFSSPRQERLVNNTLATLFNPKIFAYCMRPIKEAIVILKECASKRNQQGHKQNDLYILSNWDQHSFSHLRTSPFNEELFSYFDNRHIIISGDVGTLKPLSDIYDYFLNKYQVTPDLCTLIDDQIENIEAAQNKGFNGILLEKGNYKKLRVDLKNINAL